MDARSTELFNSYYSFSFAIIKFLACDILFSILVSYCDLLSTISLLVACLLNLFGAIFLLIGAPPGPFFKPRYRD